MSRKFILFFLLIVNIILISSCSEAGKERVTSKSELYLFLDSLEERYENACKLMQIALWNKYTKKDYPDFQTPILEFTKIFLDTSFYHIVKDWRERSGSLADKTLARRLELWYRCFISSSMLFDPELKCLEDSIKGKIESLKFLFEGKMLSIFDLEFKLQQEKREKKRRKVWSLYSSAGKEVYKDFVKLIKLRNQKANTWGFPNFYSLTIYLQSVDENWLIETFNSLEELTRENYAKQLNIIKKKLHAAELYPWDIQYASNETSTLDKRFFPKDSAISIIHRFEKNIGFEVDKLRVKEEVGSLYPNICLIFQVPNDVKLLLNPQNGVEFYKEALHNYGIALRAVNTNVEYPILKGYNVLNGAYNPFYEYGVAQVHTEFIGDSLWLLMYTRMRVKDLTYYYKKYYLTKMLELRKRLKKFFTEYEIYKNPDVNSDSLEVYFFKKYLLSNVGVNVNVEFIPLLSYINQPCKSHEVILGEILSAQLYEALCGKYNELRNTSSEVGKWMIEHLYSPGETIEWYEKLRNATGKSLEPGAYLRKLGIEYNMLITK